MIQVPEEVKGIEATEINLNENQKKGILFERLFGNWMQSFAQCAHWCHISGKMQ